MPGVIFDMDGVLVASAAPHMRSWQILAQNYGLEISPETFRATFGKTSRDIIREIWGPSTSEEDLHRLDREKEAAYRELITGCVPLMPGCREVLQLCARRAAALRWLPPGRRKTWNSCYRKG